MVVNTDDEGEGQYMMSLMAKGHECYVLCGSQIHSDSLAKQFFPNSGTNSGFRINDTTAFGATISYAVPFFRGGLEGACIYAGGLIKRKARRINYRTVQPNEKDVVNFDKLTAGHFGVAGDDLFFVKSKKYQHQFEYRLLWSIGAKTSDFIDVKCPDAIQFCTRFEDM